MPRKAGAVQGTTCTFLLPLILRERMEQEIAKQASVGRRVGLADLIIDALIAKYRLEETEVPA